MPYNGSRSRRSNRPAPQPISPPTSAPPAAASRKSAPTCQNVTVPAMAAIAVRNATSAAASLSRLSPSRMRTIRRGMPTLRATDVAATASGGATTAPSASPAASGSPGTTAQVTRPTAIVVNATRPIDRVAIAERLARMSINEVCTASA